METVVVAIVCVSAVFIVHFLVHKSFQMRLDMMRHEMTSDVLDQTFELILKKVNFLEDSLTKFSNKFEMDQERLLHIRYPLYKVHFKGDVIAEGDFSKDEFPAPFGTEKRDDIVIHHACPFEQKEKNNHSCVPVNDICFGNPSDCQKPLAEVCEGVTGEPCKKDEQCKDLTCENLQKILDAAKTTGGYYVQ